MYIEEVDRAVGTDNMLLDFTRPQLQTPAVEMYKNIFSDGRLGLLTHNFQKICNK